MEEPQTHDWSADVFVEMRAREIATVCTIPDGGLTRLLQTCEADPATRVVTLTTEEEGIGVTTGLWLGGQRAMIAMQSSGVGNCMNALGMPAVMRAPCLMLVTMRGEFGEFNLWQLPMGQSSAALLQELGCLMYRIDDPADAGPTVAAAADIAFEGLSPVAVLIAQRVIGTKKFGKTD